ncbi:hypothetical protein E2C01_016958 [Portunus trituberculatus]|uniref:Uncharacterized protein n=1 Tax=Portunus trituberculatus TaxID=210409 RepID=A0A5B7DQF4_PORTR|nr:hypothetical protein [Portunus trituberculatus]
MGSKIKSIQTGHTDHVIKANIINLEIRDGLRHWFCKPPEFLSGGEGRREEQEGEPNLLSKGRDEVTSEYNPSASARSRTSFGIDRGDAATAGQPRGFQQWVRESERREEGKIRWL